MSSLPVISHWINGAEYPSTSGRTAPVYDPALGEITKNVALANQSEIDAHFEPKYFSFAFVNTYFDFLNY